MTSIHSHRVHIIPDSSADDGASGQTSSETGSWDFEYAALLGRRRGVRRTAFSAHSHGKRSFAAAWRDDETGDTDGSGGSGVNNGSELSGAMENPATLAPTGAPGISALTDAESIALNQHIGENIAPIVDLVTQRHNGMIALLIPLVGEIGSFCADPSIAYEGNWDVQIPLDPRILPQTTLYLSLSRFSLQLRFDTKDTASTKLLLEHMSMLERELDAMLRAWGENLAIELTVW